MKKSLVTAIVSICLIFSMSVPAVAFASDGGNIYQPQWENVSSVRLTMDYSGGSVNWTGEITGYSGSAPNYIGHYHSSPMSMVWTYRVN